MTMPIETSKSAKQTLVEEGTEFKGTMKSSCPVVVNGTIDGEVDAPEITITRSGAVLGAIKAKKLRSQGTLSGNVDAGDVFLSGSVRSNTVIKAKSLEVKLGSERGQLEVTFGECTLEVGDGQRDDETTNPFAQSSEGSDVAKDLLSNAPALAGELVAESVSSPSSPSSSLSGRSPWKSARMLEASGASLDDGSKSTLR